MTNEGAGIVERLTTWRLAVQDPKKEKMQRQDLVLRRQKKKRMKEESRKQEVLKPTHP